MANSTIILTQGQLESAIRLAMSMRALGMNTRQIASLLFVSIGKVNEHQDNA